MVAANRMTTAPPMTRAIKAGTDLLRAIPDKAADEWLPSDVPQAERERLRAGARELIDEIIRELNPQVR